MASQVEASPGGSLQSGGCSNSTGTSTQTTPATGPKPRLTPKPFSLQRNTTIRSIHAPKTAATSSQKPKSIVSTFATVEPSKVSEPNSDSGKEPSKTGTSPGKTANSTPQHTAISEPTSVPQATSEIPAQTTPQQNSTLDSVLITVNPDTKGQLNLAKEDRVNLDEKISPNLSSATTNSGPASPLSDPKANHPYHPNSTNTIQPGAIQKPVITQRGYRDGRDILKPLEKKGGEEEQVGEPQISVTTPPVGTEPQDLQSNDSFTANPPASQASRLGGNRKRLSVELTSKFESGGLSLPSQPAPVSTMNTKDGVKETMNSNLKCGVTTSGQTKQEQGEAELKEDWTGGSSIKRRITLLFDSSSRPEVITKKDEQQVISQSNGVVKERIKSWAVDTNVENLKTENKPQPLPRDRTKSFESVKPVTVAAEVPPVEKMPNKPPAILHVTTKPPTKMVASPSEITSPEQLTDGTLEMNKGTPAERKTFEDSTKTSLEDTPNKSESESSGQPKPQEAQLAADNLPTTDEHGAVSPSDQPALKRDNTPCRSVHFGVVERDDGGPPQFIGSPSDSDPEPEEVSGDEGEEQSPAEVPIYRGVGMLQRQRDDIKMEERKLEESREGTEGNQREKLKVEEERKKEEDKERERQLESVQQRQGEEERELAKQKEQSIPTQEKLGDEEREREREEERPREDERERERLKEEEMERERQLEVMWQRKKEEDRARARQKEEQLEEMERERQLEVMWQRKKEEDRAKARQKEEQLSQERLREEEKEREKMREEEREKERQKEEERGRERLREEEKEKGRERKREEERLREDERERERLKEEERERERQLEVIWQRKKEEDSERARQKEERLRQEERLREEEKEKETMREKEREKEEIREEERGRLREDDSKGERKREGERLGEDERGRERLKEEEMERERQLEVMWQRKKEEDSERARQKEERLSQEEKEREKMREEEREKEKLREEEVERERLREEEREREEKREEERLMEDKRERERLKEEERNRERQLEVMWQRKKEEDRERARQKEERLRQEERLREEVREKQRLREEEKERERLKEEERERERLREEERERLREEERERLREEERERERLREEERAQERLREEERERERLREEERAQERLREEERERERLREEERERERLREEENERERLKELEKERGRQMEEMERERLRAQEEEREKERLRKESERDRQIEEERQQAEERMKEQEKEKQRQEERKRAKETGETSREEERLREEEREKQRWEKGSESVAEEERLKEQEEERERMEMQEEGRRERPKQEVEEEALEDPVEREGDDKGFGSNETNADRHRDEDSEVEESDLTCFELEGKSKSPSTSSSSPNHDPRRKTEGTEGPIKVVYDDFSVKKPLLEVVYEDFSVKPRRFGSRAKVDVNPVRMETPFTLTENVEVPEPQDAIPQIPETPKPEQAEKPEGDDEGKQEEQLNSYCAEEVLDTEVLTDCEPDQQHGDCEEASPETDSPKHILDFDQDPKVSSDDLEDDPHNVEPEPPAFPESSNPLLDTSAQRMRAELGKRRSQRTRPPRFMPQSSVPPPCTKNPSPDWRTCDSTDGKVICGKRKGSDSEEEQPRVKEVCSPPSASQRVPMFPGLSPSALMAHLKKRAGGGGEDEGVEKDRPSEETQPSPSQLPRPPRSPALLAGAARVLPPLGGTDGGSASSPSWLKELKSKKRLSQYDTEA